MFLSRSKMRPKHELLWFVQVELQFEFVLFQSMSGLRRYLDEELSSLSQLSRSVSGL